MNRRQTSIRRSPSHTPDPLGKLEERKRYMYLIASLVAFPSIYYVWWVYRDTQPFNRYAYPFLMAEALLWIGALLWRRIPLVWIERMVLFTIGLFFFAKYLYYLYFERVLIWSEIEAITGVIFIVFILGYIILDHRLAFALTLIYTALTFVTGLVRFQARDTEVLPDFIRLQTRQAVIALLTFILAKVKDDLRLAQKQTDYWEKQANIDHLTQLPNRRAMSALIQERIDAKMPFAILLIDIDDFKCFNDTYGHDIGDVLISRVAFTLKINLRMTDSAARWGGEEFLVLVNETSAEQAFSLAERLRIEVQKIDFDENLISISIGGTMFKFDDDLPKLLKRADQTLYAAKQQGRNCVCWQ